MHVAAGTPPMMVVGVDGSDPSRRALRWAADQAMLTGAELTVITTWEYPPTLGWSPPYPSDFDPNEDASKALRDTVGAVLGPDPGVVVHLTVTEGHPAFVLTEASQGAALLVVGSRGHGAFAGMLLGSVSEYCAAHASCPVVVVRHPHDKD
jgi:nucleotide-binding universal stress UspA family protein